MNIVVRLFDFDDDQIHIHFVLTDEMIEFLEQKGIDKEAFIEEEKLWFDTYVAPELRKKHALSDELLCQVLCLSDNPQRDEKSLRQAAPQELDPLTSFSQYIRDDIYAEMILFEK